MIYWIPSAVTQPLHLWAKQDPHVPLHCQVSDWNGAFYPDFELLLEKQLGITCLSLQLDGSNFEQCIDAIYRHVLKGERTILDFIHTPNEFRRELFLSQLESLGKIDIGLYDCADLLSLLDEELLLCFRLNGAVPDVLLFWLDYISKKVQIRPLLLTNDRTKCLGRLKGAVKVALPDIAKSEILSTSLNSVQSLTGLTVEKAALEDLLWMSGSLEEFLHTVQQKAIRGTLIQMKQ